MKAEEKIASGKMGGLRPVEFCRPIISGGDGLMKAADRFGAIDKIRPVDMIGSNIADTFAVSAKYGGGSHVPMVWSDESTMSLYERIASGKFNPVMSSNTLPVDWQNLWDALRFDVTVKKTAMPTIRQFIYNIRTNPNFTRILKPTELGKVSIYFERNNGHGQPVPQGEVLGGSYDTMQIEIEAAGFTWDLLFELFDQSVTTADIADGLLIGENSHKDNAAIDPILQFNYAGVAGSQTPANAASGAARQELLYNTLVDGKDDMRQRTHPSTGRKLDTSNLLILASAFDSENILEVSSGLPSVQDKTMNAISQIKRIIAYEGETIPLRTGNITYTGVTEGTAYMLIPADALPANGYMEIAVKRNLVVEVDAVPDVKTLAQEQRAWWYAEAIWYEGIQYFVQELTLPAW